MTAAPARSWVLRDLYISLIQLHPREFREEFGAEMLWIFDQAATNPIVASGLIADAVTSFVRQWVVGQAVWKFPAALLGGALYFMLAAGLCVPRHLPPMDAPVDFGLSPIAFPGEPGR